jgi:hypothetical protein
MMGISFEGKLGPAVRATKLAFDDIRPTGIILYIRKVGKGWEFDNSPILHKSAQSSQESGYFPGGAELAFLVQRIAILASHGR